MPFIRKARRRMSRREGAMRNMIPGPGERIGHVWTLDGGLVGCPECPKGCPGTMRVMRETETRKCALTVHAETRVHERCSWPISLSPSVSIVAASSDQTRRETTWRASFKATRQASAGGLLIGRREVLAMGMEGAASSRRYRCWQLRERREVGQIQRMRTAGVEWC
jgi:hypothetical protein